MKTDIDIKDDIYNYIKESELANTVTGSLSKTLRPDKSNAEDIVISILANPNGQIQESFVNVNIYVADVQKGTQFIEDTLRLRELCTMASELLDRGRGECYRFSLEEQRVLEVPGTNEHVINNKLLYKFSKA